MTSTALPVHPFPARMAPELALERLPRRFDGGRTVLDPMMGSGTIPVLAALQGYKAIGFDTDPLAVIIARTNGRPLNHQALTLAAERITDSARARRDEPFVHRDTESQDFIDYWFDSVAQRRLGALASAIRDAPSDIGDVLWCAFSRLIVTKDAGASRARDVSHSRPHVVRDHASFDPIERYLGAVEAVVRRHRQASHQRPGGEYLRLGRGDARCLPLRDASIDVVLTSPPYLQAIDYLRGHRLSLVWMGYTVGALRALRGTSIGTERGADLEFRHARVIRGAVGGHLSVRSERILARYVGDLLQVLSEIRRVLRPLGRATLVVADARVRGATVSVCRIVKRAADVVGMGCIEHIERRIATGSRYLPPPTEGGKNMLDRRMKVEHCITFARG